MVHLIHYELKGYRARIEYDRLAEAIKNLSGVWCHTPESTWLIETELTPQQVAGRLAPLTVVGDPLFVTRIYRDWSAFSLTQEQINWLQVRNYASFTESLTALLPLPKSIGPAFSLSKALGGK